MLIYDIACQYIIHLRDRIGHLLPAGLEIDRAIGLFHVHDHKEECFHRFASSFIPGAGIVAGEILESLWASLNRISPSTRTASLAHRVEIIDDHTSDSNHKKALGMGLLFFLFLGPILIIFQPLLFVTVLFRPEKWFHKPPFTIPKCPQQFRLLFKTYGKQRSQRPNLRDCRI